MLLKRMETYPFIKHHEIETNEQCYQLGLKEYDTFQCQYDLHFPNFKKKNTAWAFIRGYFDVHGWIKPYEQNEVPECHLSSHSLHLLKEMSMWIQIPFELNECEMKLKYTHSNCIDFLSNIYHVDVDGINNYSSTGKSIYIKSIYIQWITHGGVFDYKPCFFYKTNEHAILPLKSKESDAGYDISIISVFQEFYHHCVLYDTGIQMKLPYGYYAEIVPRSSLSKSGYMLANSVGIIDNNYTGNIFICLIKINPNASPISFPFRCCQILFRNQIHLPITESFKPFCETTRNQNGFGSTG
jgi:deoxyuridine 5'-triphosphate nucleotidohydrolase